MQIDQLLNEKQTAEILGLAVQTLRNDRATRRRWPYVKIGRRVLYRPSDIQRIIDASVIGGAK